MANQMIETSGTLASAVTERLRADILSGRLPPGGKLKIEDMSKRYVSGTSPVREALNRLAAEGLVQQTDQRGFRAAPVDLDDLRELIAARVAIESIALERSIAARDTVWEEALVLAYWRLSRTPRSIAQSGFETNPDWEARHSEFHAALIANCGSRYLSRYAGELRQRADRYRQLAAARSYPVRQVDDEHKAILDAAIEGRVQEASALLTEHYTRTLGIIEAMATDLFAS